MEKEGKVNQGTRRTKGGAWAFLDKNDYLFEKRAVQRVQSVGGAWHEKGNFVGRGEKRFSCLGKQEEKERRKKANYTGSPQ